ncbi:FMRFamide receptor-like [Tubulanus polymorphus]|uniref:FMRFamide receptor-like n=1 Tax=Tubulanus polymorphus TaxID=672921 RepID=UPI003DA38D71
MEVLNGTLANREDDIELHKIIRLYVMCIVLPLVCLIGLIGNMLSFTVWWREGGKTSTNFLLLALSAVDGLFLLNYFCYQSLSYLLSYNNIKNPAFKYMNNLFWITKFMAIYTMIIIAVDRCIAVCLPLYATVWVTVRRTKIIFTSMVIVCVVYNSPRFIKSEYTTYKNRTYRLAYMIVLYIIIYFVIPLLALMISNLILISNIRKSDRERATMLITTASNAPTPSQSNTHNITQILILIITCFILCEMPAFVFSMLEIVYSGKKLSKQADISLNIYKMITELLFACNSSVNFFIYCLKGKKFRRLLKSMLSCSDQRRNRKLCNYNSQTVQTTI